MTEVRVDSPASTEADKNIATAGSDTAVQAPGDDPANQDLPPDAPGSTKDAPTAAQLQAAAAQSAKVATVVGGAMSRLRGGRQLDLAKIAGELTSALVTQLDLHDQGNRDALIASAPVRMLMAASRKAVMGDLAAVAPFEPLDEDVTAPQVVDHFVGMAETVLRSANRSGQVARDAIKARVDSVFTQAAAPTEKFDALAKLCKAFLPVLSDADRVEKHFGVAPLPDGQSSGMSDVSGKASDIWVRHLSEANADFDDLKSVVNAYLDRRVNPVRVEDLGTGWAKIDALFVRLAAADMPGRLKTLRDGEAAPDSVKEVRAGLELCRAALQAQPLLRKVPFGKGAYVIAPLERGLAEIENLVAA